LRMLGSYCGKHPLAGFETIVVVISTNRDRAICSSPVGNVYAPAPERGSARRFVIDEISATLALDRRAVDGRSPS